MYTDLLCKEVIVREQIQPEKVRAPVVSVSRAVVFVMIHRESVLLIPNRWDGSPACADNLPHHLCTNACKFNNNK